MSHKDSGPSRSTTDDASLVHLKPILGLKPAHYLTGLYAFAIALILFFLLFYPGLHARGSYLAVTTFPSKATVTVDGTYAGSTPCTIFLKKGSRTVEITKPFYNSVTLQEKVGGRVFATLFVPDRKRTRQPLTVSDVDGLTKWALGDFQKNPEIPQIISDAARAARDDTSHLKVYDLIDNALRVVTAEAQVREMLLAAARASTRDSFLSPAGFISLVQDGIQLKEKYDNFPSWLLLVLTRDNANKLASSEWVQSYLTAYRTTISKYYEARFPPSVGSGGRAVSVGGLTFRSVPAGELMMGKDDNLDSLGKTIDQLLPHPVAVDAFYLGETEVTNRQYAAFVAENGQWAPSNTQTLVQQGLASDTYLSQWTDGRPATGTEDMPVTSVSYFAAAAYCDWLSQRVRGALPGYVARLPLESEWEWAARGGLRGMPYPLGEKPGASVFFRKGMTGPARAGTSEPNAFGLRDMMGNVWEWCADSFGSSSHLLSSLDAKLNLSYEKALPAGPDHVVRGGSWNNLSDQIKVYTRGSQPAEWTTPYLGFRVALARQ